LPIRGDGEIIGQTPVQVQVVPQSVRVIVPLTQARREAFPQ
jgi:diacylglycerol kinase family enzyme